LLGGGCGLCMYMIWVSKGLRVPLRNWDCCNWPGVDCGVLFGGVRLRSVNRCEQSGISGVSAVMVVVGL